MCFRNAFELICDLLIFHLSAETMTDGKAVVTELALIFKYLMYAEISIRQPAFEDILEFDLRM